MAFIPVLACIQARLQFLCDNGVFAENVFYHATPSAPTPTDLDNIGAAWQDWATESFTVMNTPDWKMTGVALRAMNEEEGIGEIYTTGFPLTGTIGEVPSPGQVSYTVTWATGLVGRSARGRSYGLPPPPSYIATHNRLTDAGRSALNVAWGNVLTIFDDAGYAPQVVSFQEGGVPRTEGRKLPILACNVRFPLATQRRRLS